MVVQQRYCEHQHQHVPPSRKIEQGRNIDGGGGLPQGALHEYGSACAASNTCGRCVAGGGIEVCRKQADGTDTGEQGHRKHKKKPEKRMGEVGHVIFCEHVLALSIHGQCAIFISSAVPRLGEHEVSAVCGLRFD